MSLRLLLLGCALALVACAEPAPTPGGWGAPPPKRDDGAGVPSVNDAQTDVRDPARLMVLDVLEGARRGKGYPRWRAILGGKVCTTPGDAVLSLVGGDGRERPLGTAPMLRLDQTGDDPKEALEPVAQLVVLLDLRPVAFEGRDRLLRPLLGWSPRNARGLTTSRIGFGDGTLYEDATEPLRSADDLYGPLDALERWEGDPDRWTEIVLVTAPDDGSGANGLRAARELGVPVHVLALTEPGDDQSAALKEIAAATGGEFHPVLNLNVPRKPQAFLEAIAGDMRSRCVVTTKAWGARAGLMPRPHLRVRASVGDRTVVADGVVPRPAAGWGYRLRWIGRVALWVGAALVLLLLRMLIARLLRKEPEPEDTRTPLGHVVVVVGEQQDERIPIHSRSIRIGRGEGSHVLLVDKTVSREHATLLLEPEKGTAALRDVTRLPNRTFVNEVPLQDTPRYVGRRDRIRLGSIEVRLELTEDWRRS